MIQCPLQWIRRLAAGNVQLLPEPSRGGRHAEDTSTSIDTAISQLESRPLEYDESQRSFLATAARTFGSAAEVG